MNKIQLIFVFLFLVSKSFSQCNVEKHTTDNMQIVVSGQETLFTHADETGGVTVYLCTSAGKDVIKGTQYCTLVVEVLVVGSYDLIVPRKLEISFSGSSDLIIEALSLNSPIYDNGRTSQRAYFALTGGEISKLKSNEMETISVVDTRRNEAIPCKPYKYLVSEQLNCVLKNFINN